MLRNTALALALLPSLAGAQTPLVCAGHDAMAALLAERWGEVQQSIAIDGRGALFEVFASSESGTWSLLVTGPGEQTCLVISGHSWQAAKPAPEGDLG